jgi:hypothetical protein
MLKRYVVGLLLLCLTGATHAKVVPIEIDTTAYGGSKFSANFLDFSYDGQLNFNGSAFSTSGILYIGSARTDLGGPPIAKTGIGNDYNLFATFAGTGTAAVDPSGTLVTSTFSTYNTEFFLKPIGGGADVPLIDATLVKGEAIRHAGQAKGDFNIELHVIENHNPGIINPGQYPHVFLTGVNSFDDGVVIPPTTLIGNGFSGSGNISAVPEPVSMAMLLAGLGIMGIVRLRRNS